MPSKKFDQEGRRLAAGQASIIARGADDGALIFGEFPNLHCENAPC